MKNYTEKEERALAVYLSIFLLLVMGIATSGYVSFRNFEGEIRHQAEDQISAIAELKVNELVNWRKERLSDAGFLYHNSAFSALVERYFENPDDVETQTQILSALEYYKVYNQYDKLYLLDATGFERLSISIAAPDLSDSHLARDAVDCLRSGEIVFLDFHHPTRESHEIHLTVLVPIFTSNNKPLGVLALSIDPQTYLYPYIQNWPIPSDTAETLLVRRNGEEVLFLNELRFEKNAALDLRFPLTNTDIPAVKVVLGQVGIVEGTDYRGEQVLAEVRAVPDSPWFLISKMDTAEVYAPLRARLWQTFLITGMAILVAGAGLALVWRQQRILFYRSQAEVAAAVRDSEEKFRKAFVLSPDSININRLKDGMYVSINNGFTKITGYAADEVIGKTSIDLNIWADPQDRKKLMEGLAKNGEVENLETRFLMKNGEIRYGLMSASVLELNGAQHIISITRDITERRQAEEALRQSEENLATTLHSIGDGVISTDKNGLVTNMNPVAEKYCGWMLTEAKGQPLSRVFNIINAETRKSVENPMARVMESGQIAGLANHTVLISKNGAEYQIADSAAPIKNKEGKITGVVLAFSDVTEKYKAEEARVISEANLQALINNRNESIWSIDDNYNLVICNDYFRNAYAAAYNVELKIGSNLVGILSPEIRAFWKPKYDATLSGQKISFEFKETIQDKLYYFDVFLNPIFSGKEITGVSAISVDITERKQAEERLAQFFSVTPDLLCIADLEGNFIKVNSAWESILGYSAAVLEQRKFLDFVHPEDMDATLEVMPTLEKQKQVLNFVNRYRCLDGSYRFIEWRSQPSGNLIYAAARDITERKRAEEELSRQTALFRNLFEKSPEAITIVDQDDHILNVNRSFETLFGYSEAEIQGRSINDLIVPAPYLDEAEGITRTTLGDGLVVERETVRCTKNGYPVNVLMIGYPIIVDGNVIGGSGIYRDITERKQAEKALHESEEKMSSIFRVVPTGIGVVRDRVLVEINPRISEMTGYTKEELIGQSSRILYPTQEEFESVGKEKYAQIAQKGSGIVETHWQQKDGSIIDVLLSSTPIDLADLSKGVTFTALDITERKRAEEALKESEAIFTSFLEHSPVYVFFKDKDIRSLKLSKNYEQMLGMPISSLLGKTMDELFPSDLAKSMVADDLRILNEGKRITVVEELNGHTYETTKFPVLKDGKPYILAGFTLDITERRQAEDALRESRSMFSSLVESMPQNVFSKDLNGRFTFANQNYCRTEGKPLADILGKTDFELHPVYLAQKYSADDRHVMETKRPMEQVEIHQPLGGEKSYVQVTKAPIYNAEGQVKGMLGIFWDVTERKRAEEALHITLAKYKTLFESFPLGISVTDEAGNILEANPVAEKILGVSSEEHIRRRIDSPEWCVVRPDGTSMSPDELAGMRALKEKKLVENTEMGILKPDNSVAWLSITAAPLPVEGYGVVITYSDITERKQAEEALRHQNEYLLALRETALELVSQLDLETLLENIVKRAGQIMGTDSGYLDLVDIKTGQLVPRIGFGALAESLSYPVQPGEGVAGIVWQTGEPLMVNDYDNWPGRVSGYTRGILSSIVGVPLVSGNRVLGVLGLGHEFVTHRTFDKKSVEIMTQFSRMAAIAIENARLFESAQQELNERKQAEEALRAAEEKYRNIFENVMEAITQTTPEGQYITANPATARILGYDSPGELIASISELGRQFYVKPGRREEFKQLMDEHGTVSGFESEVYRKNGSRIWILENSRAVRDEHGNLLYYEGTAQDITERKRVEEALLESEERFHAYYDNATIGLYRTTPDGRILMLNPAGVRMLGFDSFDEISSRNLEDAEFEASRREFRENIEQGDIVIGLESKWTRKDGSTIFVRESAKAFRDENGKILYYDGSFEDVTGRVQAEAALRETEELYRKMNENSPLGMHFYNLTEDNQLVFVGANPAADKLLGVDNSQFIGKTIEEAFPPLTQTEVPRRYREAAANGTPWSTEQISYEDRQIIGAFEVKAFQTTPGNMVAVFADITARKRAEEALQESEKMFRVAFDNAPTGMSLIGSDGFTYMAVNPLLCEMFGYTKEEFLGKTVNLVTHPDDEERSNQWIIKKYNDEPCEPEIEKRYVHKDGHIVWGLVRAQWIKNEDGSHRMAIAHILDITARKQAEEALRESEALYRQAIEVANAVPYRQSYHIDGQTVRYDFIGEGIHQITGYGPEEFDEPLWDSLVEERFLLEELAEYSFDEAIHRVRSGSNPVWKCEHRIHARDESIHWVFEAAVELRDQNGVSHGSIGLFQDVTARKQAEEEVRQLNLLLEQRIIERTTQLETANKELEAFSYSVSHDLRAPLRGIDGWSQALVEDYYEQLDEQGRLYVERVRSETQRMGHLIDDMLQLSRLTRAEMVKKRVDLSALAQAIVERMKRDEPQRKVIFNIQTGITAEGDPHLLDAVLSNLLGNAFKFTGKRLNARIEFGQTDFQNQRIFFVRDNGAGFDMAYSQKLFGAFQRMHKASEFPGTGIGLATVQRIIHRHGGRVWAEAEVERGATFYFTLG